MSENAVEKRLARRQLQLKPSSSYSWFIDVKNILWKYLLPDAELLLECPYSTSKWKQLVNMKINEHWKHICDSI